MLGTVECPHLGQGDFSNLLISDEAEHRNRINLECYLCEKQNGNLWMCLKKDCLKVFCSDVGPGHTYTHFKKDLSHCLHMNVTSLRIWCHECNVEVGTMSVPDDSKPTGLVGFQNLGNTCYMNAALQSLSNTQPLVEYFLNMSPISVPRPQVTRAFHKLIVEYWSQENGYVAPHSLLYAIRHSHPMYRGFQQHDSQEFLRSLLDQIHEEMKTPALEPLKMENQVLLQRDDFSDFENGSTDNDEYETCDSGVSERSSQSDQLSQKILSRSSSPVLTDSGFWNLSNSQNSSVAPGSPVLCPKRHLNYRSIVSDVFNGSLLSSVQCLACNRISSRVETFQDLSLPIPNRDTIHILHQNGNGGQHSKCGHLVNSDQGWLAWILDCVWYWLWGPQISLHDCLSAFFSADELKGDNMYCCEKCQKLRNGIKYSRLLKCPEVLCIHLKRFRHEPLSSSKISSHISFPLEGLDMLQYMVPDNGSSGVTKYRLSSVICHHGAGGSSGHYTSFAWSRLTEKWYHFDDLSVTEVSEAVVSSARAYVLFYRKDSNKIERARARASKLQELTSTEDKRYYLSKNWLLRFNTFSEPGPIDNRLLLCGHNCVSPGSEYVVISAAVWKYLLTRFGGGPEIPVDNTSPCDVCSEVPGADGDFLRLQLLEFNRLQNQDLGEPFVISQTWLKSWEEFVKGKSASHPGPLNCHGKTVEITGASGEFLSLIYGVSNTGNSVQYLNTSRPQSPMELSDFESR